ncbi:hypothetical protein IWZ00DRAFT_285769 [Phyllosticta capitalensis]|uniref:uncharacterized protein n=1 Tax=Phyllosticta capitalensis TaxID=121624 RepID=UPI00312EE0F2
MRSTLLLSLAFGLAASSPLEKRQKIAFQSVAAAAESVIATLPAAALGPTNVGVVATTQAPATSAYNLPSAISKATSSITVANSPNTSLAPTSLPANAKSAAKRELEQRDSAAASSTSCATYTGKGPVVTSSPSAWINDPALTSAATNAPVPTGYVQADGFQNLKGSLQMMGYLTVKSLDTYDTQACANYCDNEPLCMGFDIYYERDPAANTTCSPGKNPDSITFIGCTLYGFHVNASLATNTGQWRDNFQVVITASNGYNKVGVKHPGIYDNIPGFSKPVELGNASIDALFWPPAVFDSVDAAGNNKLYTYMGMRSLQQPYDARVCASICSAQTAANKNSPDKQTGTYMPCNFFTAYVLAKNDVPVGLQCAFYMLPWNTTYATNTGYYDYPNWPKQDVSNHYTIYNSMAFTASSFAQGTADFGNNNTLAGSYWTNPNAFHSS